jgi:hypothetical protein
MNEQINKADELLFKSGASEEESRLTLDHLRNALATQIQFNQLQRDANEKLSDFERDRSRIQKDEDAGLLAHAAGEGEVLRLEKQRVVELKKIAAAMLAAAGTDPARIKQAQDFLEGVLDIERSIRAATDVGAKTITTAADALESSLVHSLGEGEVAALKFSSVWKQVALDVMSAVRRMITQFLIMKAVTGLLSLFGGKPGIGGPGSGAGEAGPGPVLAARGGRLRGAGTGTSDSNLGFVRPGNRPFFYSDGEYLIPSPIVRQPGAFEFLEGFRGGGMDALPRLISGHDAVYGFEESGAPGGGVAPRAAASAPAKVHLEGGFTVEASPGLILKELRTPAGRRGLFQILSENANAISQILGR